MITADGGGSNGSRLRLWKWSLQQLADETGRMASLNITRDAFHPEWNYKISPRNPNMKR